MIDDSKNSMKYLTVLLLITFPIFNLSAHQPALNEENTNSPSKAYLIEKPETKMAPSLLGIQGRYVFTPRLFNHLKRTSVGSGGEIQLTDAMKSLSQVQKMYSWTFSGKRYDIGTMKDWFQSHLELSTESEYSSVLRSVLKKL